MSRLLSRSVLIDCLPHGHSCFAAFAYNNFCFYLVFSDCAQAQGEVAVIEMRATAQANAIRTIAESLSSSHAEEAAKLAVAREVRFVYHAVIIRIL